MGGRIALVVLSVFATAWAWAALRLSGAAPSLILVPITISLVLLTSGWRGSGRFPSRGRHVGRVVGLWSSVEVVALFITANVLQTLHRPDLMFPLGAIIVGLHFFPLARGIPVRLYHATGGAFVVAGLVGLLLRGNERSIVVGVSAALILWTTALMVVRRARQAEA